MRMMRIKSIMLGLAAIAILAPAPFAYAESGEVKLNDKPDEPTYHTIKKGDTLWDISETYQKDPFKWPKLWKINPYIKNPHLIYPGNIVKITPNGIEIIDKVGIGDVVERTGLLVVELSPAEERVVTLEPEAVEPEAPKAEEPAKEPELVVMGVPSNVAGRHGFLTKDRVEASGTIISSKDDKVLLSTGDNVFISFKSDEVKAGDKFTAFTVGKQIKHPTNKKSLGNMITVLGVVEVVTGGKPAEGRITTAYMEMGKGVRLMPYEEHETEFIITEPDESISGKVVASADNETEMAEGRLIYIDKGSDDKVESGDVMGVYRKRNKVKDLEARGKKSIELPDEDIGRVLVIDARKNVSACVVLGSAKSILVNDDVRAVGR